LPILGDHIQPTKHQLRDLKWFLRTALRNYETWDRLTITERDEYDAAGLKLRDRFVSYLEVLLAFSKLGWPEKTMIFKNLAMGVSQEKIAEHLGIHPVTVSRRMTAAYRQMIATIWDEK